MTILSLADWTCGGSGLVLMPTTHLSRTSGKCVPAYGIGIQVESAGWKGGMSSIARWTAASEERRAELASKLAKWTEV